MAYIGCPKHNTTNSCCSQCTSEKFEELYTTIAAAESEASRLRAQIETHKHNLMQYVDLAQQRSDLLAQARTNHEREVTDLARSFQEDKNRLQNQLIRRTAERNEAQESVAALRLLLSQVTELAFDCYDDIPEPSDEALIDRIKELANEAELGAKKRNDEAANYGRALGAAREEITRLREALATIEAEEPSASTSVWCQVPDTDNRDDCYKAGIDLGAARARMELASIARVALRKDKP